MYVSIICDTIKRHAVHASYFNHHSRLATTALLVLALFQSIATPVTPFPSSKISETFGLAQTKLFDAYFRFSLLCLAVAGFSAAGLSSTREGGDPVLGKTPFLVALGCVALNLFFFGPQTTISMMERRRVCKELGVDRKSLDPQV